jgi:structural hemagglutinin/hemolysin toxin protein RtxA
MYKICFYAPTTHVEQVKEAMFTAGAGKIGAYSCCAWQVLGEGQFMPLEDSDAFIGEKNQIETLEEYKVEMVCTQECIHAVITAMKESHPYEEPAYQVFRIEEF